MRTFILVGENEAIEAVLKLIPHEMIDRKEGRYEVSVAEGDVDDLYEASDVAGVKVRVG